ncbi:MAG: M15 family metallopeptidase, partial [Actinomycetia bacterium]|nr:M15 family metallopeptidase [Actinomycetes bacterium]
TDEANAALEEKVVAEEASRSATARATNALSKAHRLGLELENRQQLLRDWAFNAYVEGGAAAEMMAVFDAMMTDPEGAGNPVGDLNYLTEERIRLVDDIRVITENKEAAAEVAQSESARARAEAVKASQAEAKAKAAVDRHSEVIEQAQGGQVDILTDAAPLAVMLVGMQSPEAKQRGEAILEALIENNIEIPEVGRPCSDDESTYANGTLPATALCPLWGAEQHRARPGAAVAFNALSQKFAQDFGRPICVTDSYRTFADQVSVKARRGHWAATPGTSRHGLGMALDLCGGINNFGTIEHLWMKRNAPLYGWYHPSWAAAGGRLPEPWHWEYAG